MIIHLYHKIRFAILKKKIKKNHCVGEVCADETYDYKEGSYGIKYRIIKDNSGKESIEWISQRRRIRTDERWIKRIGNNLFKFWHYQGWLVFFRPPVLFLLLTSIFLFYFGFVEIEKTKVERFKWIVASVVGVSPQQIEYIGDGWLEISGERKRAGDRINEPIRYAVNPFRWLFSSKAGFVTRWRGEPYGYATYPVVYNKRGEVWVSKEGKWLHGRIYGKEVKWDTLQRVGSKAIGGHEISTKDKKLRVIDK